MRGTPWGQPETTRELAAGITSFTTGSHGGINLSLQRIAEMPDELRRILPFAGPGWYEEDLDWALVTLAFPHFFDHRQVHNAVRIIAGTASIECLAPAAAWLASTTGEHVRSLAERWAKERAHLYRLVSFGSIPRRHEALVAGFKPADPFKRTFLSWCAFRRIGDDAPAEALLFDSEVYGKPDGIDLSAIPAERILAQPAAAVMV